MHMLTRACVKALRLYPLPDVLVLADKCDAYNLTYEGCTTFNPGSFVTTDFSFLVYRPSKLRSPTGTVDGKHEYDTRVEFSKLP